MGLDLWFREDIARILASTHEAMRRSMGATAPLEVESAAIYQQGFADALQAVAVAFGLAMPTIADGLERAGYGARYDSAPLAVGSEPLGTWRQKTS